MGAAPARCAQAPGRRRPWRARALAACLACASRAGRALHLEAPAAPALGTARLRPDGAYALAPDEPIEFTFEPQAEARGVGLQGLRLLVWDEAGGVAFDSGEVATGEPRALALLEPGAYTWGVRWRASSGEVAPLATSVLRVAVRDGDWRGVPWLGCPGYDRFAAEADGLRGRVSVLVAIPSFGYVTVNGRPLSQDLLSPSGWTNTEKRVLFRTYDATELLNSTGGARIAVHLGGGYREDPRHLLPDHPNDANRAARASHDEAPLVLRLQLRSSDGIRLHSGSPGWVKSRADPDANNSLYSGESTGTRGPVWEPVDEAQDVGGGPSGRMVAAAFPAVRATRVDSPVRIWREGRVQVVDFGSNVAGVCRVSVPAGTPGLPATLHMRHGEVLQHAGTPRARWERGGPNPRRVYFTNLRDAQARDRIHVPAEGVAGAFPRFTYHGFRYVEVYDFPVDLSEVTFERLVVGTAVETKTEASFTDEVLQAIHRGAVGSQRSNLMGQVVTDCPQRDERLGWLGDAGLSAQSMMQHFHLAPVAAAFVDSIADELGEDGSLPDVVPFQRQGARPADPTWSAAFVELLRVLHQDGHPQPVRKHWAVLKAHLAHLRRAVEARGGIASSPERYGDWCSPPRQQGTPCRWAEGCRGTAGERPSPGFVAAFSLVRAFRAAAALGEALGGDAARDAEEYRRQAREWGEQFQAAFYHPATATYDTGTMASHVLPLALELAPPGDARTAVVGNLLHLIQDSNYSWTGGIVTNRFLFDVLHDSGHADVALRMLQHRSYPSYGYMFFNSLEPASECMWEVPDAPFQGMEMNSRNHHAYSSVGGYLIERVAGLQVHRGGEIVAVAGAFEGGANATVNLARGTAAFSWSAPAGAGCSAEVSVPVGMLARVHLPAGAGAALRLAGWGALREGAAERGALAAPPGVRGVAAAAVQGRRFLVATLESGSYRLDVVRSQG